ncbi:hypothetical protein Y032_0268g791 [Ancylostoma ceylanicum]|uniref:Secreted protein n=1 Tax=Ancylostoma ceylanicum TaxID=53326 RepID=A0A016SA22_9BILA|nr:hypothetical protein Y032_0268g791 [Ancylostoma ceylanicum]
MVAIWVVLIVDLFVRLLSLTSCSYDLNLNIVCYPGETSVYISAWPANAPHPMMRGVLLAAVQQTTF